MEFEMGGSYGTYRGEDKLIHGFERKPEGKKPLGKLQYRWGTQLKCRVCRMVSSRSV